MAELPDTTWREGIGLLLLVGGIAIVPMGWLGGGGVLSVAVLMLSVGIWMFYTPRIRARDMAARQAEAEAQEREIAEAPSHDEANTGPDRRSDA